MALIKQKQIDGLVSGLDSKFDKSGGVVTGAIVLPSDPTANLQAATKQYVDNAVTSSTSYKGGYDATTNTPNLDSSPVGVKQGDMYTVTVAGTFFTVGVEVGDVVIAEIDNPTVEADWTILNKNLDAASIKIAYESNADTNAFTDAEKAKVGHVTVTQAVDLDTLESDTATNNVKVTNATHTGDIAGSTVLTAQKTLITNKPAVIPVVGDHVLIADASDSDNLKRVDVSVFLGGGAAFNEEDVACPVTAASTNFDVTLALTPTGGIAGIGSIHINGAAVSAAELISVVDAAVTLNVPYAVDTADVVTVRYI